MLLSPFLGQWEFGEIGTVLNRLELWMIRAAVVAWLFGERCTDKVDKARFFFFFFLCWFGWMDGRIEIDLGSL